MKEGTLEDAGYYTIDFPDAVSVKAGESAVNVPQNAQEIVDEAYKIIG